MSRSRHHGCGKACGLCRPHKLWKRNRLKDLRPSVRRRLGEPTELARTQRS